MRKTVLYMTLTGCFLFALLLESVFTQAPQPGSESAAALTVGEGHWVAVPEFPPDDWLPAPQTPRPSRRGNSEGRTPPAADPDTPAVPASTSERIVVKSGDNLWDLAAKHLGRGSKYRDLARWNGLRPDAVLDEGAVLRLSPPDPLRVLPQGPATPATTGDASFRTHRVARGETLSEIAEHYLHSSAAWKRIRDLNSLPSDRVTEGLVLRIPAAQ